MVFGQYTGGHLSAHRIIFQFPLGIRWCSDGKMKGGRRVAEKDFNSPWELDGVRTAGKTPGPWPTESNFNSPWELDGVRTLSEIFTQDIEDIFQFPLGIRWCSDQ